MTRAPITCFLLTSMVSASAALAAVSSFITPADHTLGGLPVNARATFTTGNGTVHIVLKNLTVDPRAVAQNLSALAFALSANQATGNLASSSGTFRTVANTTYTDTGTGATGWRLENNYDLGSAALRVCDLCPGAAGPAHTLIGFPAANGKYTNANASILGNRPHNPFLANDAVFDLVVPGVTERTTVTKVRFQFGAADGQAFVDISTVVSVEPRPWDFVKRLYR